MDNNNYEQQPSYNQQPNQSNTGVSLEPPITLGDWIITLIILAIPCVNLVMLFVWGFGQGSTSKKNFCRAYLIFMLVAVVLSVIFYGVIAGLVASSMSSFY